MTLNRHNLCPPGMQRSAADRKVVTIEGVKEEVRTYHFDAPEFAGCGGLCSTELVERAIAYTDGDQTIYLV